MIRKGLLAGAVLLLLAGVVFGGWATYQEGVGPTPDGQGVQVSFDLLNFFEYAQKGASEWTRLGVGEDSAWRYVAQTLTVPFDYVGFMVCEHPLKTLGGVALGLELGDVTHTTPLREWVGLDEDDDGDEDGASGTQTGVASGSDGGAAASTPAGNGNTSIAAKDVVYNAPVTYIINSTVNGGE